MPSSRIPTPGTLRPGGEPADGMPEHYRRIVSFTSRGGRLNAVQKRAFDAYAHRWYLEATDLGGAIDSPSLFGRDAPLVIEVGSGMGESTAAMAQARPEINVLAIEVYRPGIAQTLHHLAGRGVGNVRILRADAVPVLDELVPADSLEELWLFFPDPWPKNKHHKRRIVTDSFVTLVASRLRAGGVFRLGTDIEQYAEVMLEVCSRNRLLRNRNDSFGPRPEFRPTTRFEGRGLDEGRAIFDLEFERIG
ncbi:MAG: tRNA (guanosine(46)-N7)-methyltransferase TrmB [Nakamurella sp.]